MWHSRRLNTGDNDPRLFVIERVGLRTSITCICKAAQAANVPERQMTPNTVVLKGANHMPSWRKWYILTDRYPTSCTGPCTRFQIQSKPAAEDNTGHSGAGDPWPFFSYLKSWSSSFHIPCELLIIEVSEARCFKSLGSLYPRKPGRITRKDGVKPPKPARLANLNYQ